MAREEEQVDAARQEDTPATPVVAGALYCALSLWLCVWSTLQPRGSVSCRREDRTLRVQVSGHRELDDEMGMGIIRESPMTVEVN